MATVIDELMITLGIDGKDAKKGMKEVESSVTSGMKNITASMQTGLASMSKIFTGFGAALMGAFSIGSAFSTWKEQAAELGAVSKRLHMNIEDLQGWTGAVGKFGGSASDFENSLRGLNAQLAKMAVLGKSRTGTFLQSLGIDPGELGRQRDALAVLEDLAAVMEQMSPDEARAAGQALGFDSSMIMLLQQGRDGMKDLIRQKKEDAIYTQEDADAVKQYSVEMGKLKKNFMGIMGIMFRAVMPAFTMVTKYLGQFVAYIRKHQTAVKAFFVMIAVLLTRMLIPAFIAFTRTLMANPLTWVILALVALALVIEDFIVWLDGGESALDRFWASIFGDPATAKKNIEEIKQRFDGFIETVKYFFDEVISGRAWQRLKENASTAIQRIKDRWQIFVRDVQMKWERFKRDISAPFERAGQAIDELKARWQAFTAEIQAKWDSLCNSINETWQWVKDSIAEGWQWLNDSISEILEWIQTKAEEAWQWIRTKCQEALNFVISKWQEFKAAALEAINSLFAPIEAIAAAIRDTIGGAIDWAIQKWNALKSFVGAGVEMSGGTSDMSYLGLKGGSSTTNNNSTTVSVGAVNVHGVQDGRNFGNGFVSGITANKYNPGVW